MSVEGDSALRIDEGHRPLRLSIARIGQVEQSAGERRHTTRGALIGMVVGTLAAEIIVGGDNSSLKADVYVPAGIMLGMVGGGMVGYFSTTDEWEEVATFTAP